MKYYYGCNGVIKMLWTNAPYIPILVTPIRWQNWENTFWPCAGNIFMMAIFNPWLKKSQQYFLKFRKLLCGKVWRWSLHYFPQLFFFCLPDVFQLPPFPSPAEFCADIRSARLAGRERTIKQRQRWLQNADSCNTDICPILDRPQ